MMITLLHALLLLTAIFAPAEATAPKINDTKTPAQAQVDDAKTNDPKLKLAVLAGKWKTEGAFADGRKTSSDLECRWSAQQDYLVCEQVVKFPEGEHRQLTAYSYSNAEHVYRYTTIADPGALPSSGTVEINGTLWTYHSSFERAGKTTQIRTTNDFSVANAETFKVETSQDGVTWTTAMQGSAHKVSQ
jgi:uncharacterized protein DUF1579